jgi:N-acetylglucosamine malate deacetylase 1
MNPHKLDILVFAAHPDDAELAVSGTLLKHHSLGYKTGIADLTLGELGSRGTPETRMDEAANASEILKLSQRVNLGLADGFFQNDKAAQIKLIEVIRYFQPEIIFINAPTDRHPDHGKGAQLAKDACFLSGLIKIETSYKGAAQMHWRAKRVFHYIQDKYLEPDFVVDISDFFEQKMEAIQAYKTQFNAKNGDGPATYISSDIFIESIKARAQEMGKKIGVAYGEGFINTGHSIGFNNIFDQVLPELT